MDAECATSRRSSCSCGGFEVEGQGVREAYEDAYGALNVLIYDVDPLHTGSMVYSVPVSAIFEMVTGVLTAENRMRWCLGDMSMTHFACTD
jgi:hypothetical protein